MSNPEYTKKRAYFDVLMSLFTCGFWAIWMAYSRYKNY